MKLVEIYKLQDNGDQTIIVVCRLGEDGTAVCEGEAAFIQNLESEGINDYSELGSEKKLFPKDGLKFLENLKLAFKSGYLNATDILEK